MTVFKCEIFFCLASSSLLLQIRNVAGTAQDKPMKPYSSWLELWVSETGRRKPKVCAINGCRSKRGIGGCHVTLPYARDIPAMPYYILPCSGCNHYTNKRWMWTSHPLVEISYY